jgi:EAL domain-containing protein (putative c-di-GMP-specific phosphodiesterase class I)
VQVGGDDAEALLGHADVAQYRAKELGRNRVETFDIELRDTIERRLDTEQALRDAIAGHQITAWYQPLVDMRTGAIVGAEALARWVHPTRGLLLAPEFIPLAEESGLIFPIDTRVVAASVDARIHLHELGVPPTFRIWCNVSARLVARGEPADRLVALLRRTGCDPRGIGIEITETAVLPDRDAIARQISTLREFGVECSLDDFGTGYSSLTLLQTLPIDAVKIDREFVHDLGIDPTDTAIVRSLVRLAADLGLDVVAEGVETQEQADMLLAMGCRYAQGYLWSPAVPLDELIGVLTREGHAVA